MSKLKQESSGKDFCIAEAIPLCLYLYETSFELGFKKNRILYSRA
jgi:hypothetical protein